MTALLRARLLAAMQRHQSGELEVAERLYRQILADFPAQCETQHLLGVLALQSDRIPLAVDLIRSAIAHRPNFVEAHANLGVALHKLGDVEAAIESLSTAVRLNPKLAEAHCNLGNALRCVGRHDEAIAACGRALALNPTYANALNHLGLALSAAGRTDDAVAAYQRTLELQPRHLEALRNLASELQSQQRLADAVELLQRALDVDPTDQQTLALLGTTFHLRGDFAAAEQVLRQAALAPSVSASTLAELGNVLQDQYRHAEAIVFYQRAVELRPDYAKALFNWANSLRALRRPHEGLDVIQRALALEPDSPEGITNQGFLLYTADQVEEAIVLHRRAIELSPNFAEAWNNLGPPLFEIGEYDAGLAACEHALALDPTMASAHLNRGMFLLANGNYAEGWREYEFRSKTKLRKPVNLNTTRPKWDGSPLAGRHLLLIAEQGLGDTLQFIRYAHLLPSLGGRVSMVVPPRLLGILSSVPTEVQFIPANDPWPDHDVYSELLSVCQHITPSIEQIPAPIPYLKARPDLVDRWRDELAAYPGFRIGIAWQGSSSQADYRRVPVEHFAHLARIPGVRLISLQTDGAAELQACRERVPVVDFADRLDKEHGAFQDTAALMMNLDLVVSSDTSVPHVAGALGRPVWLALRLAAEWRWLRFRQDTPWYPSMRLFRQRARRDWSDVLQRMAAEVEAQLSNKSDTTPSSGASS